MIQKQTFGKKVLLIIGASLSILLTLGLLYIMKVGLMSVIVQYSGISVLVGVFIVAVAALGLAKAKNNPHLSSQQRLIVFILLASCAFGGLTAIALGLGPEVFGASSVFIVGLLAFMSFIILQIGFVFLLVSVWRGGKKQSERQ